MPAATNGPTPNPSTTSPDVTSSILSDQASAPGPTTGFVELAPEAGRLVDPRQIIPNEPRQASSDRPWVFANMVVSLDGATALDGVSGGIGGEGDRTMFRAIRSSADAIIAGSQTVIQERYRPAKPNSQGNTPLIVVISGSLELPADLPLFQSPSQRPLIATTSQASAEHRSSLTSVADVADFGTDHVDLQLLLDHLGQLGIRRALLEGGPTLNGHFIQEELVDEWNLTLSPTLVAGPSSRASRSPLASSASTFQLRRLWKFEETLFGRWVKAEAKGHQAT